MTSKFVAVERSQLQLANDLASLAGWFDRMFSQLGGFDENRLNTEAFPDLNELFNQARQKTLTLMPNRWPDLYNLVPPEANQTTFISIIRGWCGTFKGIIEAYLNPRRAGHPVPTS